MTPSTASEPAVICTEWKRSPWMIGMLSQLRPDGPMIVLVDPTKSLRFQSHMLVLAFEFIFNEPDAEWDVIDTVNPDGTPLRFRTIRVRVED